MSYNNSDTNVGLLLLQNAQNSRTLTPQAVGSQVVIMTVVSAVVIIAFNLLRPSNKVIYEPRVKYHVEGKTPPRISGSLLGWIPPLIHTKEPELLDKIGLDAVIYLRFLRMFRSLFATIAVLTCLVLIPINVIFTNRIVKNASQRDALLSLTINSLTGSNILYVHVGVAYVITFIVMIFIWFNWRKVVALRQEWYRSPEYVESFYARTLMIEKVPKKLQSDEGIRAVFSSVHVPYATTSVHIGRKVGYLPELIDEHNNTVAELEAVLVRYLKNGQLAKLRPTLRVGGFMGLGGEKVDAIEYYTEKLRRSEAAIDGYRQQIDLRKAESYGFASMAAVPYAHIVANMLSDKHPKGANVKLAPNPKDIIWENLSRSAGEIQRKRMTGFLFLAVVCFLNTIPLFAISLLANLSSFSDSVPFLASWSKMSSASFSVLSGVLPPAVSGIFGYLLPIIVRRLSKYSGAHTRSKLDRAVVARYFSFLVISQLLIFTLIGIGIKLVISVISDIQSHKSSKMIYEDFKKFPGLAVTTYIAQSSYWLAYFPLRGFLVVFDLAQIFNLIFISVKTKLFGRTPREIREWTKPAPFEFAIYYANILFMGAVALMFAPLAPLVVVAATVVMWLSSWVYKYQLMFVFTTKVETGGRMWNVAINRLLVSAVLMNLLMVLTTFLQSGLKTFLWISAVPPIIILLIFKLYLNRKFNENFKYYVPSQTDIQGAKINSERADHKGNRLESRFGHPSLHVELFTPLVHQNMIPLLGSVYKGKISREQLKLQEYGGQKAVGQSVGGIKIAGIEQNDLEYDARLYQRDRGEADWDSRTMGSTTVYGSDQASLMTPGNDPSQYFGSPLFEGSPAPTVYDRYGNNGYSLHNPMSSRSDIELARVDTRQQEHDHYPLLVAAQQQSDYRAHAPQLSYSHQQLAENEYPPSVASPRMYYREAEFSPPPASYRSEGAASHEAVVHRQGPPSRQNIGGFYQMPRSDGNLAGRGAHRT